MLDPETAAQALRNWCEKRGVETGVAEFVAYLEDKDALYLLPVVKKVLANKAQEDTSRNSLTAETARKLSGTQQESLQSAFGALGSDFTEEVNEKRIAGVDATFSSQQVQGSVASQLAKLQTDLTS